MTDSDNATPTATPMPLFASIILTGLVVGLLAAGIVAGTYLQLGTVEGLRAATSLVMPLSLIWLLLLATSVWWFSRRRRKLGLVYLAIWIAMTLAFNRYAANWVVSPLEYQAASEAGSGNPNIPLRTVVVLGGGVGKTVDGDPEVNRDGQRVISAALLWHAGRTKTIVCTGNRPGIDDNQSEIARELLLGLGVPDEAIFEISGENTSQEMRNLKEFLGQSPPKVKGHGQVGLITSAFHIPRAMRLAGEQGIDLNPMPCSFRTRRPIPFSLDHLIPGLESGVTMRIAIKEYLAGIVGR